MERRGEVLDKKEEGRGDVLHEKRKPEGRKNKGPVML